MVENKIYASSSRASGDIPPSFMLHASRDDGSVDPQFLRNSHLRSSSAGVVPSSMTPIRTTNSNHYANLRIEDDIISNVQRQEDKKLSFKLPFPPSIKGYTNNGVSLLRGGAGPLTKPPRCFLQPKSRNVSMTTSEMFQQPQQVYQTAPSEQLYYQGKI